MEPIIINGKYASAHIFTDNIDTLCERQIRGVCNHEAFEGSSIRIMPDIHAGKGCVIGFTATMPTLKVIPNLIGVDIGCGVLTTEIPDRIDTSIEGLMALDHFIRRNVPFGQNVRKEPHSLFVDQDPELTQEVIRISQDVLEQPYQRHLKSPGSLGGGNHFIEISREKTTGKCYLHIHSGSRNLGNAIAIHYQKLAINECEDQNLIPELRYLEGERAEEYLRDMRIAQRFAALNRRIMVHEIIGEATGDAFDTIHNFIDENNIIRKGSVSASEGERLLIPLNMRDGALLCKGKGNPEFNFSAPHGAGRIHSRTAAKKLLSMDEFHQTMEGIYTTSVTRSTLDEAPMAYKPIEAILNYITPTADVVGHFKPIYNFKAPG